MNIWESILSSLTNLRAHKLRSFLTMLGMIIGISAVIIILSIGAGTQGLIFDQLSSIGTNLIGILPGQSDDNGPPASVLGISVTTLKYEDVLALRQKRNTPHILEVAGYVRGSGSVTWNSKDISTSFTGTTANYIDVEDAQIMIGRFFDESEERGVSRVAVLGSNLARDLFGEQNPVGQDIKIKREIFKVIGVLKERGSSIFVNQDDEVFVPLLTAQRILLGINHLNFVRAKVDATENIDSSIEDVKAVLRDRHDIDDPAEDDFTVRGMNTAADILAQVTNALKFFLVAIASIALLVGGIGIMNIMLVAVNERIREIGLRKAVGATNKDIIGQFVVETMIISFVGGLIGIVAGIIVSGMVALFINYFGYDWDFIISLNSIILASGFSLITGLVFGIYPALKASKLDPIIALKYE